MSSQGTIFRVVAGLGFANLVMAGGLAMVLIQLHCIPGSVSLWSVLIHKGHGSHVGVPKKRVN